MEILAFTKIKKYIPSFLIAALVIFTVACQKDDYDLGENQKSMVLEVMADIMPQKNELSLKDTIWIEIDASTLTFKDYIIDDSVTLDTAEFLCQIQLYDRIYNEVVDMELVLKSGKNLNQGEIPSPTNNYSFSFGGADDYKLKLGILFTQPGRYAIGFNNFPNPKFCDDANCKFGEGIYYDVYHTWSESTQEFLVQDFADYLFRINNADYVAPDLDLENEYDNQISVNSIYNESVFFVIVN